MLIDQLVIMFIYLILVVGIFTLLETLYSGFIKKKSEVLELRPSRTKQIELPYISSDILTMLSENDKFHSLVFDENGVHLVINE